MSKSSKRKGAGKPAKAHRRTGADIEHRLSINSVRFGIEQARGDFIVIGDSDGSYDFSTIEKFIRPLQDGADLVMGNPFLGGIRPGLSVIMPTYNDTWCRDRVGELKRLNRRTRTTGPFRDVTCARYASA